MGGFSSIGSAIGLASQLAGVASSASKSFGKYNDVTSNYAQAKKIYDENDRNLTEQAQLEARKIQIERDEATRNRKNTLARSVAEQQVKFSAQGIDTTDGSGEAALLGMYKESSEQKAYREKLEKLKAESLNQQLASDRRRNLLTLQSSYSNARNGLLSNFDKYTGYDDSKTN